VAKARSTVAEKAHELSEAELDQIAEHAGIGAVKYADLSTSRTKDLAAPTMEDDAQTAVAVPAGRAGGCAESSQR